MHVDRVGAKLVEILESEDAAQLASGIVSDHPDERRIYEGLLAVTERSNAATKERLKSGHAGGTVSIQHAVA